MRKNKDQYIFLKDISPHKFYHLKKAKNQLGKLKHRVYFNNLLNTHLGKSLHKYQQQNRLNNQLDKFKCKIQKNYQQKSLINKLIHKNELIIIHNNAKDIILHISWLQNLQNITENYSNYYSSSQMDLQNKWLDRFKHIFLQLNQKSSLLNKLMHINELIHLKNKKFRLCHHLHKYLSKFLTFDHQIDYRDKYQRKFSLYQAYSFQQGIIKHRVLIVYLHNN